MTAPNQNNLMIALQCFGKLDNASRELLLSTLQEQQEKEQEKKQPITDTKRQEELETLAMIKILTRDHNSKKRYISRRARVYGNNTQVDGVGLST